jgi:poly-gamma-glutamate capsule biosynthesis protein CapA/YwtB (metallophosphatase superfamily)
MAFPTTREELQNMIDEAVAKALRNAKEEHALALDRQAQEHALNTQIMIDEAVAKALHKAKEEHALAIDRLKQEHALATSQAVRDALDMQRYVDFISERKRIAQCTTPCRYTNAFYWSQ